MAIQMQALEKFIAATNQYVSKVVFYSVGVSPDPGCFVIQNVQELKCSRGRRVGKDRTCVPITGVPKPNTSSDVLE